MIVEGDLEFMQNTIGKAGEFQVGFVRRHAAAHGLFEIEPAKADIHQCIGLHDVGRATLDHRHVHVILPKRRPDQMGTGEPSRILVSGVLH